MQLQCNGYARRQQYVGPPTMPQAWQAAGVVVKNDRAGRRHKNAIQVPGCGGNSTRPKRYLTQPVTTRARENSARRRKFAEREICAYSVTVPKTKRNTTWKPVANTVIANGNKH